MARTLIRELRRQTVLNEVGKGRLSMLSSITLHLYFSYGSIGLIFGKTA